MKNLQIGLIARALIGIIVFLVIGGGFYIYSNKYASDTNYTTNGNIVGGDKDEHGCIGSAGYTWCEVKNKCLRAWEEECGVSVTTNCVNNGDEVPIIYSLSVNSGLVGSEVEINGCKLNGYGGGTILSFKKENGESGFLEVNSYIPEGATSIKFTIPEKMCTKFMGQSGIPCPGFMRITPGIYTIYIQPWATKSNEVKFTITEPAVACTMDAKQCPDGSYVGRTGPNCEFVCPNVKSDVTNLNIDKNDSVFEVHINIEDKAGAVSDWYSHTNKKIGFSFKYPESWKVDDILSSTSCCLNLFNSINPYPGSYRLDEDVMKVQFQHHTNSNITDRQQYINYLLNSFDGGISEYGAESQINRDSIVNMNNKNNVEILKFYGGIGNDDYIIPIKKDYSEVLFIIVWNPDPIFEKVIESFSFL
jgi:hypothetical protein